MANKVFALVLFGAAAVSFYYGFVYNAQGQPGASHFMLGLGGATMVVGLIGLTGK